MSESSSNSDNDASLPQYDACGVTQPVPLLAMVEEEDGVALVGILDWRRNEGRVWVPGMDEWSRIKKTECKVGARGRLWQSSTQLSSYTR